MKNVLLDRTPDRGFSLVEVVAAIGITAFALVAILSLFATLLGTEREAITRTTIPAISASVLHALKVAQQSDPPEPLPLTLYFTNEGARVDAAGLAIYSCAVTVQPAVITGGLDAGPTVSLVNMTIKRADSNQVLKTIHASLRYE